KIYDSFLQRHTESLQQQSYPISDARTISPAGGALKTGPQLTKIWMTTIIAGGMFGFGLGLFRELMDRGFRTGEQVRSALQTECLGLVPLVTDQTAGPRMSEGSTSNGGRRVGSGRYSASQILRTITDAPSSPYAEAVRSIKLTVDLNSPDKFTKVI